MARKYPKCPKCGKAMTRAYQLWKHQGKGVCYRCAKKDEIGSWF
tara:strand:- start:365 stop:496 length:132 start_codon:yes stop_codon:yes gene_type:complete